MKSKAKAAKESKRSFTKAQEVMYMQEFKRANRIAEHSSKK
ncbi:YfhE family protein [Pontibacillus salicampi]|uniref:YfhE family protein n=1 Tax=Pontibacillus salicampi TaxID=1449801 RepID=A0ABV6LI31_9BACI